MNPNSQEGSMPSVLLTESKYPAQASARHTQGSLGSEQPWTGRSEADDPLPPIFPVLVSPQLHTFANTTVCVVTWQIGLSN